MIKKLAKFFCVCPLLFAFTLTHVSLTGFADQVQPDFGVRDEKEKTDLCIKKLKEQQDRIKEEMDLLKRMVKSRQDQNRQGKDKP